MNALSYRQKFRLGLFVVCALTLLMVSILLLTGLALGSPRLTLRARFTDSVSGLERNGPVRYQGLRIGRVESIAVADDAPEAIEVRLSVDPCTKLFVGTVAQLDPAGLTGLKAINLTPGDVHGERLKENDLVPARGSFFDKITNNATAMVTDVRHVADQMSHLLSDESRSRLEHLITGLDKLVYHTDDLLNRPDQPIEALLRHVTLLAQAATQTAEAITQTSTVVREQLQRSKPTLETLGPTLQHLDRLVQDTDDTVRASREDVLHTLGAIREVSENLREVSAQVADNPAVMLRGRSHKSP
jgi:phospholipid/cholesterol/gamma-HCH transport system substrate-binding protein